MELTLGIVSNVWAALLDGSSLEALCGRAVEEGYGYVELRQGALGECERPGTVGGPVPDADRLGNLARRSALGFNLALAVPFFTPGAALDDGLFASAIEGTLALDTEAPPFLRLVDPTPARTRLDPDDFAACVDGLRTLVARAAEAGVTLALENSSRPLSALRQLIDVVGEQVHPEFRPLLCWDPANMLTSPVEPEDPHAAIRSLAAADLALFHFKQLRGGAPQPEVAEGDIDWLRLLRPLAARGYDGPALFEIPPGEDAWERLGRSRGYVEGIHGALSVER